MVTGWNAALCSGPSVVCCPPSRQQKGSLWRSSSMSGVVIGMRKVTPQPEMSTPDGAQEACLPSTSVEAWAPAGCRWSRGKLPPLKQFVRSPPAPGRPGVVALNQTVLGVHCTATGLFAGCMSGRWFQHDVGPFWNVVGGRWDPTFQEVCGVG